MAHDNRNNANTDGNKLLFTNNACVWHILISKKAISWSSLPLRRLWAGLRTCQPYALSHPDARLTL
jgi:hypothetical protein